MKFLRSLLLTVAFSAACSLLAPTPARADVSFNFFYGSLSPRGSWASVPDYGYCWRPAGVNVGWRPYTDGYWAYTDAGWTWVSYEDWGGITYHYGRWTLVDGYGWVWVPGYEWGPGWVSWRRNDDYVGWAPLPPECRFGPGISIGFSVDSTYGIGPGWYNFCGVRDFGSPSLGPVIIDRSRNVNIINNTVNITNITYANGGARNGGPSYQFISRRTSQPIQRLTLTRSASPAALGSRFQSVKGGRLQLVAPAISRSAGVKPPAVARTFSRAAINHGWNGVPAATQQSLRSRFKQERGPKSLATLPKSPAAPVAPAASTATGAPSKRVRKAGAPATTAGASNPELRPFKPASSQAGESLRETRRTQHLTAPKATTAVVPKTKVLTPRTGESFHAPKPERESTAQPLKLRTPPAQPKVSTAGGSGRRDDKKDDRKDDRKDQ